MSGRSRRTYHPVIPGEGDEIVLGPEESHHVARVLRLRTGDGVAVFDGRGGEWEARIVALSSGSVRLKVGAPRDGTIEAPIFVEIVQGVCRADRIEWMLQKGTEVGVAAFTLVLFARSEGADPSPAKLERWRKILLEACKQSGRRSLPELVYRADPGPVDPGDLGIVLDAEAGAPPIGARLAAAPVPRVRIAVGPEGGFAPGEVETLAGSGWTRAGLGPRVLRTETAGPIAAALVLHAWGDLGRAGEVDSAARAP